MNCETVGVIGCGVVGGAIADAAMHRELKVRRFDIDPERATHTEEETVDSDIVFVCLPTPELASGRHDTLKLHGFFNRHRSSTAHFVLKSTVPVGFTRHVATEYKLPNLLFSPEFLTARTAYTDVLGASLHVIGTSDGKVPTSARLTRFYRTVSICPVKICDFETAEFMKLAMNVTFAAKVAIWNEIALFADAVNVDFDDVRRLVVAEGRTTELHTLVPGPDGKTGFGGACLPKDLAAFIWQASQHGLNCRVAEAALTWRNDRASPQS